MKLEDYLKLKYPITLYPETEGFSVEIKHLPGCISQGETLEEALEMLEDAKYAWIKTNLELGNPILLPNPRTQVLFNVSKSGEVPESWLQSYYYFEVRWLTDDIPREEKQRQSSFRKYTIQLFKKRNIQGLTSKESLNSLIQMSKEKVWLNLGLVKYVTEKDFHKFYFDVSQSLLFEEYFYITHPYPSLEKLKTRCVAGKIDSISRKQILEDIKSEFFNTDKKRRFEKRYDFKNFAIEVIIGISSDAGELKRKYSDIDNVLLSIVNRYCYVKFVDTFKPFDDVENFKEISKGRLKIQGNSISCGDWKYDFDDESYIYGHPFFDAEFYSSDSSGKFIIWVIEEEAGEFYERSEHHE